MNTRERSATRLALSCALALCGACETKLMDAPMGQAGAPASGLGAPAAGANATPGASGSGGAAGSAGALQGTAGTTTGAAGTAVPMAGTTGAAGSGGAAPTAGSGGSSSAAGPGGMAGTDVPDEPELQTCPDTSELQPGETNETVQVGGVTRSYILHVPPSYTGTTPVPLVVDWHPILTSSTFERGNSGYAAKADAEGFIVAFPEGTDTAWNVGQCCTSSRSVDDLGFARALVDAIEARGCVDAKRVYSVGYSMGGGMTMHLACNQADVFAAFAPAAFQLMEEDEWPCHPSRPIAIIQFNGTADFIVPYGGGASNPPNGLPVTNHFLGAEATFEKYAQLSGCTGTPMVAANGCNTYTQCGGGVEVALCVKQGGGHETGDPDVAWEFMQRFTLP